MSSFGAIDGMKTEIDQGVQIGGGHQIDAAAIPAVAPVGSAKGDVFFPPEADAAVAAVAGFDSNSRFVNKFHGVLTKNPVRDGAFDDSSE